VTREPARCEKGALRNLRTCACCLNGEFQPGQARVAHLGAKAQDVRWAKRLDAPEIERLALDQVVRVATAPTKTGSADEAIQQPAGFPRPTGRGIAVIPTD
jgi:hypothetical protein